MTIPPRNTGKKTGTKGRSAVMFLGAAFMLMALAGCGQGLPDTVTKRADALEKDLKNTDKFIRTQKEKFAKTAESKSFEPMAAYAQKENWAQGFDQAGQTLARANDLYGKELGPILKKDDPKSADQALRQIMRISRTVNEARQQAHSPFERMDRIQTAMTQTQSVYVDGGNAGRQVMDRIREVESGPVAQAREKFTGSRPAIDERFAPLSKMAADTTARLAVLEKEYAAFEKTGAADFAALVNSSDGMIGDNQQLDTLVPGIKKDFDQLYTSYTKVLQDMKVDYYVTIKRESWNENADSYQPGFTSFTRQVSPATFQALTESEQDTIADLTPLFGKPTFKNHIGNTWQSLDIHPMSNWPSRYHNAAAFWVESGAPACYHKYIQETDGETQETDWVKVNPSFYEQNINNLGMAILSKPYGEFEPDPQAAPPGMAYVGNPAYGEWKQDKNGGSFWSWYGRYAFFSNLFFFPAYRYNYGGWDRWNRNYKHQKPYYGESSSGGTTFGTWGSSTRKNPRYQDTTFSKTGGFKTSQASVRGMSSTLRGGGPKGKGK